MSENVYRAVQKQLDQYCIGFPATKSGVEIDIIKELFKSEMIFISAMFKV